MPSDCAQSGSAVYCRWCGPAHMYTAISAQKCTIDRRYEYTGRPACLGTK